MDPASYIQNLFAEEWYIQIKIKVSSNGIYIKVIRSKYDTKVFKCLFIII